MPSRPKIQWPSLLKRSTCATCCPHVKYRQSPVHHTRAQSPISPEFKETKPPPTLGRPRRTVSTLTPSLLTEADYLDLAGTRRIRISFPLSAAGADLEVHYLPGGSRPFTPFPPSARGFLYFAPQPNLPYLAASLRFRCTPTPSPSSFPDGHDLLLPTSLPWQTVLAQAVVSRSTVLRNQLLREGHISPAQISAWRACLSTRARATSPRLLFRGGLAQSFPILFERALNLAVVGDDTVYDIHMNHIFTDPDHGKRKYPWKGSAVARFEQAPRKPHVLNLRIVRLVDPVVPNTTSSAAGGGEEQRGRLVRPRAGRLLTVRSHRKLGLGAALDLNLNLNASLPNAGAPLIGVDAGMDGVQVDPDDDGDSDGEPWEYDIRADNPNAKALRVLIGVDGGPQVA
ncbi:hypothetical protein B0H11DRAFT_394721 [Mycena galericulata]|nr:hypothetical protein B0H11DRAFT_394721 [Mycena galericulata]